ncbi:MAG TPA: ergothioneine biosynthesis protein EgtB [Terracidiphilus sp.]|nr:ergothioneine biosynthesis protein EgtB [Terracidiphilus sp.]
MTATAAATERQRGLAERFGAVRRRTLELCKPLTPEDMMVQSCAEASPAKWHLAHTAWFFESFVLREFVPGYKPFDEDFRWLFNSYYVSYASFPEKRLRASFSRPGLDEVLRYRAHVDAAMERLMEGDVPAEALRRTELGANHEEQHQELLLTDILHALYSNPLKPVYAGSEREAGAARAMGWESFGGGMREIGHAGEGFCYDNELARHKVWLEPHALADRLVTNGEYAEFMADGGYERAELWLSAGWDAVEREGWRAPLYWTERDGAWRIFTLRGEQALEARRGAAVSQVSFFEADAYARWAGRRLATEFEWEAAAAEQRIAGNLLDAGRLTPGAATTDGQWFGDCWEWTASAYLGYPGFKPLEGALGEYNGKFMSGQMVLRGGSCATPLAHIRASYRNFFAPETRWQFAGIRLAK